MKKIALKISFYLLMTVLLLLTCLNNSYSQNSNPIPYLKGTVWGFCDFNKKITIVPQYNYVSPFYEGFAVVRKDTKYGMIDETGKIVIPIEYTNVTAFYDGISSVQDDEKYGGYDKTGK